MKKFRLESSGQVTARFESREADLLAQLARDTGALLAGADQVAEPSTDPALLRLLPNAYPDDAEASAEFRRFTAAGLAERKVQNSEIVANSLTNPKGSRVTVQLDPQGVQAWLRTLTDIRLVLASRLGIEHDGDLGFRGNASNRHRALIYSWVGYVQESLLHALNSQPKR
jgi:hypothetical protein